MDFERKIEVEFETTVSDFQRILVWYRWKRLFVEFSLMLIIGIPFCYFIGFNLLENGWAAIGFIFTLLILFVLNIYGLVFRRAEALKRITEPAKTIFSEQSLETNNEIYSYKQSMGKLRKNLRNGQRLYILSDRKRICRNSQTLFQKSRRY